MNQKQMYYQAVRKQTDADLVFMEMIKHPTDPLTADELRRLIAKYPQRWKRYEGFIPLLDRAI